EAIPVYLLLSNRVNSLRLIPLVSSLIDIYWLLVCDRPVIDYDATLIELCELFADKTGNWVGQSAMCRALQKLGLNRKKKQSGVPKRAQREF
ncbi:hypothetical protein LC608_34655, partial [Nostoc sp. XA010]|uniref:hypothetical protein n=1 Tax=Nostoc sp. XA010 TaxID=2780407 RepID=UPI0035A833B4|nr:hypothetical protein [Nostoc sp. XA010]